MKNRSRPPNMLGLKFEIAMLPVLRVPYWHDCSVRVDPAYRKMLLRTCVICSSHTDTSSGALPSEEFTNLHDVAPKWQINGGAYCSSCVSFARLDIANCPKLRAPLYAESESCVDLDHFIIPKQLPRSYAGYGPSIHSLLTWSRASCHSGSPCSFGFFLRAWRRFSSS